MKYRINYTIWDYDDSYIIEWETIEEIREKVINEQNKRWLDVEKNNLWSEKIC